MRSQNYQQHFCQIKIPVTKNQAPFIPKNIVYMSGYLMNTIISHSTHCSHMPLAHYSWYALSPPSLYFLFFFSFTCSKGKE